MAQLRDGDEFPALQGQSVNHGSISLPGNIPAGNYAVIFAYRAHW